MATVWYCWCGEMYEPNIGRGGSQGGESIRTESWRDTCCKMFIWREENIKLDVSEMVGGWEMDGSTITGQFPRCSLVLTVH